MKFATPVLALLAGACTIPDLPYAGPRCSNGTCQLDAQTMYVVNVTDGFLRSDADVITFNAYRSGVIDAFDNAPGALGVTLRFRGLEIATTSIWTDEASLAAFAAGGPHTDAEVALANSIVPPFVAQHFAMRGSELPISIDEALARIHAAAERSTASTAGAAGAKVRE